MPTDSLQSLSGGRQSCAAPSWRSMLPCPLPVQARSYSCASIRPRGSKSETHTRHRTDMSALLRDAMDVIVAGLTLFLEFQSTSALPCANTPASHPPIPLPTLRASPNSPPSGTQSPLGASIAKYGTPLGFSGSSDIGLESVEASARSSIPRKTIGGREAGRRAASNSLERSFEDAFSGELYRQLSCSTAGRGRDLRSAKVRSDV
jgi:hypothetical protein